MANILHNKNYKPLKKLIMKFSKFYLWALLAIGVASCSKEVVSPAENDTSEKSIVLSISKGTSSRAAIGSVPGDTEVAGPGIINDVEIYITDASGIILRSQKVASTDDDWTKLTSVTGLKFVNVQATVSKVYVFGNLGSTSLVALGENISTVNLEKTLANQQLMNNILYIGHDDDITPVASEPIAPDETVGETYKAEVTLTPIVSRFQITKISFAATGTESITKTIGGVDVSSDVSWTSFTGNLIGVYMNRFYTTNINRTPTVLRYNTTSVASIENGTWMFGADDLASISAYFNFSSSYQTIPLPDGTTKCYGFNFFPENMEAGMIPKLHLALTGLTTTGLTSSNLNVYNPSLFPTTTAITNYINVTGFKKEGSSTLMTNADFEANKLYNLEIVIKPYFLEGDITHIQYNVIVVVTVAPWTVQNLTPDFSIN